MDTKYVIFALISSLLVAAIYSSTAMYYASAVQYTHVCFKHTTFSHNMQTCCWFGTNDKEIWTETCWTDDCGAKGLNCEFPNEYALNKLHKKFGCLLDQNDKCIESPNAGALNDNGILEGSNNTSNDNVKEPKAPKLPEDSGSLVHEGR